MISALVSRRDFLSTTLLLPMLARQTSEARLIGAVPLVAPGVSAPPFGRLLGDGLDARLFTDLSTLAAPGTPHLAPRTSPDAPRSSPDAPRTSTEEFFVRTATPSNLPPIDSWTLHIAGRLAAPLDLRLRDLESHISPSRRIIL
jgi:hypothetical protein